MYKESIDKYLQFNIIYNYRGLGGKFGGGAPITIEGLSCKKDVADVCLDVLDDNDDRWVVRGFARVVAEGIDAQIAGWSSVAAAACGWNNALNWGTEVTPVVRSNNGLKRDAPYVALVNDCWGGVGLDVSRVFSSTLGLRSTHWRLIDGRRNRMINIVNATKRIIQNTAIIVFVTIRVSKAFESIILDLYCE